jgi:hypothetical protein
MEGGSEAAGRLSMPPSIAIVRWIFMRISSIDSSAATLASDMALLIGKSSHHRRS